MAPSVYKYEFSLCNAESDFQPDWITAWMRENWLWSVYLSGFYGLSIFLGQKIMARRAAFDLRNCLVAWNLAVAVFSILGAVRFAPAFFHTLLTHGLGHSVCVMDYAHGVSGFWTTAFMISKVVEFGDTVFLVLRKRNVIFLHWYHHVSVLIYTWHAFKDHTANGRWYVMMNYAVHSIMYLYYGLHAMGYRFPKWLPMSITMFQLSQMFIGCMVTGLAFYTKFYTQRPCAQTDENLKFAFLMYLSYYLLFAHFFYKAYFVSRKYEKAKKEKADQDQEMSNGISKSEKYPNPDSQNSKLAESTANGHVVADAVAQSTVASHVNGNLSRKRRPIRAD